MKGRIPARRALAQVALGLALAISPAAADSHGGGMNADGLIIRVQQGIVFVDIGANDGVMKGDYFNIISSETLTHPLTGDTLAVTPKNIGAIQIHQSNPNMAIARILHLMPGEDVMLKPIDRVGADPERLAEIERFAKQELFRSLGLDIPRRLAVVPGVYQMRLGEKRKGWALLATGTVSFAAAIGYRASSNDWLDQYEGLPAGLPQAEYDRYFNTADERRSRSNRLFWLAGAVYAYNWVDVLWMGGRAGAMRARTLQSLHTEMGLGFASDGDPLFQLVRRF